MVVLVALDQLLPFIRRRVEGVVDSVLVSRRARACGAVSGDVRSDAHFSTPTQRHPGEYAACDTSLSNAHHVGCPRRAHGITGVQPNRSVLPGNYCQSNALDGVASTS